MPLLFYEVSDIAFRKLYAAAFYCDVLSLRLKVRFACIYACASFL